ncbi:MAG TPA: hypothetical protein VLT59_03085, partial [Steroidobacteraceae bacterium]|nr:hypothetical protein [Steroidobacteraceae bacterium]
MSLRSYLLLLCLLTLALPWAGCQYAREMERALRIGQEAALLTTARSLSNVIAAEPDALYRDPGMRTGFDTAQGDLFAPILPTRPLLDGFDDEWPASWSSSTRASDDTLRAGIVSRTLYLFAAFDLPARAQDLRLVLLTRDDDGIERAWSIDVSGDGPAIANTARIGIPWRAEDRRETRISGTVRGTSKGFTAELRLPLRLVGDHLAAFVLDGAGRVVGGTERLVWLHQASEALTRQLAAMAAPQMRLSVVDAQGWLLARAGSLAPPSDAHLREVRREEGLRQALYRRLLARPELPAPPVRIPLAIVGPP